MSHHQHTPEQPHSLDEWHDHPNVVPMEEHGAHVNVRFLLIFYVLMVAFIIVTTFGLVVFFKWSRTQLSEELVENTYEYQMEYLPAAEEQKSRLTEYAWMSREDQTVRVPVPVAARTVIERYRGPGGAAEETND